MTASWQRTPAPTLRRRLISRFPTAKLKARLVSMAAEQGIVIIAADPACTSKRGAQH